MERMVANNPGVHIGANLGNMELARVDEQVYQLELQAYQIAFPNFKYEPPSFVSMEIGTNTRATSVASSTFGPDPRKQHVVTTKQSIPL
jgi:hypothetical protein